MKKILAMLVMCLLLMGGTAFGQQSGVSKLFLPPALNPNYLIAMGLATKFKTAHVIGRDTLFDTGANKAHQDMRYWTDDQTGCSAIPVPSKAEYFHVISTSAKDSTDLSDYIQAGVSVVEVHGLDANWNELDETIILSGTSRVSLANQMVRVNYFHVDQVGSGASPYGNITLTNYNGGVTYSIIEAGDNSAAQAYFTVPKDMIGLITGWRTNSYGTNSICYHLDVTAFQQESGGHGSTGSGASVFITRDQLTSNYEGHFNDFKIPIYVPEKCDIKISAHAHSTADTGAASFQLLLKMD